MVEPDWAPVSMRQVCLFGSGYLELLATPKSSTHGGPVCTPARPPIRPWLALGTPSHGNSLMYAMLLGTYLVLLVVIFLFKDTNTPGLSLLQCSDRPRLHNWHSIATCQQEPKSYHQALPAGAV